MIIYEVLISFKTVYPQLLLQWFLFFIEFITTCDLSLFFMFEKVELTTILRVAPSLQPRFEEHVRIATYYHCRFEKVIE